MTRPPRPPTPGLSFNPGNHRYKLDGPYVPSVTAILDILNKPALIKWASKLVGEFVADNPDDIETLRRMGRDTLVRSLTNLPDEAKNTGGKRGTVLHEHAADLLNGLEIEVAEQDVPVMESAMTFMDDWCIDPLLIEAPVASRTHLWAGTLDFIARYAHPVTGHTGTAIFDWKSGKALYPEYAWQLNAYAHAEFTGLHGDEHPIPPCDAAFGVHIRTDGYDVAPFAYGPHIYQEFVAIRHAYTAVKKGRGDWKIPGSGHVGIMIQKGEAA